MRWITFITVLVFGSALKTITAMSVSNNKSPAATKMVEEIITIRSSADFATTLVKLNDLIRQLGYTVTITQRCDFGLKEAGFKTDKYRVVNFGKLAEVREITANYPQLAPFLPLRIAVIAEDKETLLVILNPELFLETVKEPDLKAIVNIWQINVKWLLDAINIKL